MRYELRQAQAELATARQEIERRGGVETVRAAHSAEGLQLLSTVVGLQEKIAYLAA